MLKIDGLMIILSLTWESPYLEKMVFILRRGPDLIVLDFVYEDM